VLSTVHLHTNLYNWINMSVIKQFILRLTTGWAKKLPPPYYSVYIAAVFVYMYK